MMLDKQQKEVWDALWSRQVSYAWDPLSQTVYEFLTPYVLSLQGTKILEAGSGTGKISLRLAEGGAAVTLVDYSSQADAFFPDLDSMPEWELAEESEEQTCFDIEFTFRTYKRKQHDQT